jgi:ADP-ribosyl-[dinitrogen reductase] hydrolase
MQMNQEIINRAKAAYIGFAIGDALGATTEFMTSNEIKKVYGVHKNIVGGGWLHLKAGNITDDTEMCIYMADSIIESGYFTTENVAKYFLKWMQHKPIDIGQTVRRGLVNFKITNNCVSPYSEYSAGNGACMRNLPIILYTLKDWQHFRELTLSQCHITHNNIHSDLITLILGEITKHLIVYADKTMASSIAEKFIYEHPSYSFKKYNGENSGYIVDTFKTVMYHFLKYDNFYDTLVSVVNIGGDSDTNGALAGMLAGALYNLNGIPKRWLKKLNKKILQRITFQAEKLLEIPSIKKL